MRYFEGEILLQLLPENRCNLDNQAKIKLIMSI
jgi:hypothetical protein